MAQRRETARGRARAGSTGRDNPALPFRLSSGLIEIPAPVHTVGPVRIPYGDGFYFRLYPLWLTRALMRRDLAKAKTPVVYLHPWEFEPSPDVSERGLNRFIANYNIARTWTRLCHVLERHETVTALDLCETLTRTGTKHGLN